MARIITLLTDFGLADHYVGSLKGAILSVNPDASIVDITHDVDPQHIEQGAFILECVAPFFPQSTIHVAVVDPGVGTERRALAISTDSATFIGPDNGVLSCALPDEYRLAAQDGESAELSAGVRAVALTESRFHRSSVSATFHGRDVFAPVAGHLSLGVRPAELGPEVSDPVALPPFGGEVRPDGAVVGEILHIDRFGNAITTIRVNELPAAITVEIRGHRLQGLRRTYGELAGPASLIGSTGYLEIAIPGESAARELGLVLGDPVIVRPS